MSLPLEEREMAVVGCGPAGLCAAITAAKTGADVVVLDENDRAGGQLIKQIHRFFGSRRHGAGKRGYEIAGELERESEAAGVEMRLGNTVLGLFPGGEMMVEDRDGVYVLRARAVVVATGASEKGLAFPGWTLPGVMGAGAAQTLVNLHGVLPGRRVLMVGAGNVGLIVSYQLLQAGAEVVGILDVSERVGGYEVHRLRVQREGVPFYLGHRVVQARGRYGVEEVSVEEVGGASRKVFRADAVCLAVGLSPLAELAAMCGCRMVYSRELGGFMPWHDGDMRTDQPGVYVAGDAAGVEEASVAMEEGRMAGLSAAEDLGAMGRKEAERAKDEVRRFLWELRGGPYGEAKRRAKESVHCA